MNTPTCINLRAKYGKAYKIRHEESYKHERGEFRTEQEPWLQIIPCQHGHISPWGGDILCWSAARRGQVNTRMKQLPGVQVWQDGDDGANVLFPSSLFDQVAEIVQPKKRPPKRVLTPEQKDKLLQARAKFIAEHPDWKPGQRL